MAPPTTDAKASPGVPSTGWRRHSSSANAEAFQASGRELLIKAGKTGVLPNALVIDCEEILFVDETGADAIDRVARLCQATTAWI